MSQENVELVRRFYEALNDGDVDRLIALCHDSVEYVNPEGAAESGTRVGVAAFRNALSELLTDFSNFKCAAESMTPVGDLVAVVEQSSGTGRASGVPFAAVHGHLFTLRDGRVARFRWFHTVDELRAAVGLSE